MVVTLKEVAELAGVSRSAVSRAYTEGASVSPKTRRKVERAALELGYSPNVLARSLNTGRTSLIGLVSNNFHNPIFLEIFDLFTKGLQARDLRPLLVNLSDETDPQNSVRMLKQYSVDGVIVASSTLPTDFALAFRDAGVAVVHAFGKYSSSPNVHILGIDNVECGRMAMRTLAQRGYCKVGFIGGPQNATSTQDRLAGFQDEATRHPSVTVQHRFAGQYSFEAGRQAMTEQLAEDRAEAYFCADDVLSIGALSALRDHGLMPGRDVGVIGLNDMEMAAWAGIDLTTIRQPIRQIVSSAIELMAAMLSEPDRYPEARLFPCSLVERGTLRPAP